MNQIVDDINNANIQYKYPGPNSNTSFEYAMEQLTGQKFYWPEKLTVYDYSYVEGERYYRYEPITDDPLRPGSGDFYVDKIKEKIELYKRPPIEPPPPVDWRHHRDPLVRDIYRYIEELKRWFH